MAHYLWSVDDLDELGVQVKHSLIGKSDTCEGYGLWSGKDTDSRIVFKLTQG
jgi:hypothetical protein